MNNTPKTQRYRELLVDVWDDNSEAELLKYLEEYKVINDIMPLTIAQSGRPNLIKHYLKLGKRLPKVEPKHYPLLYSITGDMHYLLQNKDDDEVKKTIASTPIGVLRKNIKSICEADKLNLLSINKLKGLVNEVVTLGYGDKLDKEIVLSHCKLSNLAYYDVSMLATRLDSMSEEDRFSHISKLDPECLAKLLTEKPEYREIQQIICISRDDESLVAAVY